MKDGSLWMKKEEKRTAPGLKRALKAVLGHKIVRLAGIAGVSLLFSASAAQTVLADDAGVWQPVENGYYLVGMDGSIIYKRACSFSASRRICFGGGEDGGMP